MTAWNLSLDATPYEYLVTSLSTRVLEIALANPDVKLIDHGGGVMVGSWEPKGELGGADIYVQFLAPHHVAEQIQTSVKQLARRDVRLNQIDPDYPDYADEAQELVFRQHGFDEASDEALAALREKLTAPTPTS